MTAKYPLKKYDPLLCVLRVIVIGPILIPQIIAEFISRSLENVAKYLSTVIPVPYTEEWVEFDQLHIKKQEKIKKSKERMMSQVQITND